MPKNLSSYNIRKSWLDFFASKEHHILPSASLIPNNPTLLLNAAGMVPFVPYFLGQETSPHARVTTSQKCIRVGGKDSDLDNVGFTPRHLTFFEMLGNFSFGNYFKEQAIKWAYELLTEVYEFDIKDLIFSVFVGDNRIAVDNEAAEIWQSLGIPKSQIIYLGKEDNFWGPPGGISGPCGPCSEIYYQSQYMKDNNLEPIEIWNLVFMQYNQDDNQVLHSLAKPNVDTGAGLERLSAILQNKSTVFETDIFTPIITKIQSISSSIQQQHACIIADHIRCSNMLMADGVKPSNIGRGYILRMLLRRAMRFARLSNIHDLQSIAQTASHTLEDIYPELKSSNASEIIGTEQEAFNQTIEKGLKKFQLLVNEAQSNNNILNGYTVFDLYSTHGMPLELTQDLAREYNLSINLEEYNQAQTNHAKASSQNKFTVGLSQSQESQDISKLPDTEYLGYTQSSIQASDNIIVLYVNDNTLVLNKTIFYAESGGQVADTGTINTQNGEFIIKDCQKQGNIFVHTGINKNIQTNDAIIAGNINLQKRQEICKHHTATHLLQSALREVLGNNVQQAGSQVSDGKLRFDFTYNKKVSSEDLTKIAKLTNQWINQALPVQTNILDYDDAIANGALAFFEDKYNDKVRVLSIKDKESNNISIELCGGTHVQNTSEIMHAIITGESAVASGVRRIEIVVGQSAFKYLTEQNTNSLQTIKQLQNELDIQQKTIKKYQQLELKNTAKQLQDNIQYDETKQLHYICQIIDINNLREILNNINILDNNSKQLWIVIHVDKNTKKLSYACKSNTTEYIAKDIIQSIAKKLNGSGGGRNDFAQGGAVYTGQDLKNFTLNNILS